MLSRNSLRISGFTLFEVLIATAVTMILMVGLSQIFRVLGNSITKGRAGLELNNRLRNVSMRIRTDLDNLTVAGFPGSLQPPIGAGLGYLKIYDGPMTDFTMSRIDPSDTDPASGTPLLTVSSSQVNPMLSRFGDLDDIIMATVQASDTWFTGKVPRFILEGRTGAAIDENGNGIQDDLNDRVTISSQYAEIVIFAQPYSVNVSTPGAATNVPEFTATTAKNAAGNFEDAFSAISSPKDDIPDQYRLYYRQLLVRPDLNLPSGVLPNTTDNAVANSSNPLNRAFVVGRNENLAGFLPNAHPLATVPLPTPECDMYRIHQYCDLSVRRVNDFDPSTLDFVSANDLDDLARQTSENVPGRTAGGASNRFAHVQHFLGGSLWSMPVIALSPCLKFQDSDVTMPESALIAKRGFLHPTFALLGDRQGEDLLCTDLLAFDIKCFDPRAPFVADTGRTFVLRPGDPGFADPGLGSYLSAANPPIAFGDFADVGWGDSNKLTVPSTVTSWPLQARFIEGELSGVTVSPATLARSAVPSMATSGSFLTNAAGNTVLIYQPNFDTYSTGFESDLVLQGPLIGGSSVGTVQYRGSSPPSPPDVGVESSAPFVVSLRGIQISVRLEDKATKQFRQMSTIKQFMAN